MALSSLRIPVVALALVSWCAIMPIPFALASDEHAAEHASTPEEAPDSGAEDAVDYGSSDRLSAHEYFTLAPFIVPVIDKGEHRKQLVLVVAIGLYDEGHRDELRRLSPKMRNEIYQMLFRLVSFRTVEPRIPPNAVLENRLTRIARNVAGERLVKSLIVHSANVTDVR